MAMNLAPRSRSSRSPDEDRELTKQFFVTLRAVYAGLQHAPASAAPEAVRRVEELLHPKGPELWSDAYEAEQLMVGFYADETLRMELAIRMVEAHTALARPLADFYTKAAAEAKNPGEQRALLARIVNDLQWRYTVNEATHRYGRQITRSTAFSVVVALGMFLGLIAATVSFDWKFHQNDLRLAGFAALSGAWGASFSMLATLRTRIEASDLNCLKAMRSRVMLFSRILIGTGAGCILYFFALSGVLAGSAFPDLASGADGAEVSVKSLALLAVWGIVAGFSEQLVPSLLAKTEARAAGAVQRPQRSLPNPGDAANGASQRGGNGALASDPAPAVAAAPPSAISPNDPAGAHDVRDPSTPPN